MENAFHFLQTATPIAEKAAKELTQSLAGLFQDCQSKEELAVRLAILDAMVHSKVSYHLTLEMKKVTHQIKMPVENMW